MRTVVAITLIALVNTFLDPNIIGGGSELLTSEAERAAWIASTQAVRFVVCAVAIALPPVALIALLPNRLNSRWKLPLRCLVALVSLGMVFLNAFSWWVQLQGENATGAMEDAITAMSYAILAVSMLLLITLAVFFILFVVFRGAQLQRRVETRAALVAAEQGRRQEFFAQRGSIAGDIAGNDAAKNGHAPERSSMRGYVSNAMRNSIAGLARTFLLHGGLSRDEQCLAAGWSALEDELGQTYYWNAALQLSSWEHPGFAAKSVPLALPPGWSEHFDPASPTVPYYYNAATGETTYTRPKSMNICGGAVVGADAGPPPLATVEEDRPGDAEDDCSSASSSDSEGGGADAAKAQPRFVKWKWMQRADTTLADGLIGRHLDEGEATDANMPLYLRELFAAIFVDADRACTGRLSTLQLLQVLKRRARGTALDGDSHSIFALRTLLAEQAAENESITPNAFEIGLFKAIVRDGDGHVAQWILNELMDEAALWRRMPHVDAETGEAHAYYYHTERGVSVWEQPPILTELERCSTILSSARGGGRGHHRSGTGSSGSAAAAVRARATSGASV